MRDPLRSPFSNKSDFATDTSGESWLYRVRDNLAQLLLPSHLKASSANGAPIHLLKFDKSLRPARAQGASLLMHVAVFAVIILLVSRVPFDPPRRPFHPSTPLAPYKFPVIRTTSGLNPSDGGSQGGGNNPIPATHGNPPPPSPIPLVKPTIPPPQNSILPEPPTIPNATAILTPPDRMGLQWMNKDTDSPGPGKGHGIGSADGDEMGDHGLGFYGVGESTRPYGPGFIAPLCSYCPYPTYTDDARKAKVQGAVTLQVLVGADGRAQDIRIVKGIGFGLDERALETVRGWKFIPAHDGSKRAVPASVTVEAYFRLF